jgi:hypothetical protein
VLKRTSAAVRSVGLLVSLAVLLTQTAVAMPASNGAGVGAVQVPQDAPPPPAPSDVLNAKRIFVENTGSSSEMYTRFIAALNAWGRYTVVSSSTQADLIFELRDEPLSVVMVQPSSKVVLSTVSASYVPPERDQDKEETLAVQNLVSAIKQFLGTPLSAQETTQIAAPEVGKHQGLIVTLVILGSLAIAGGVVAALHGRGH